MQEKKLKKSIMQFYIFRNNGNYLMSSESQINEHFGCFHMKQLFGVETYIYA